MTENDIICMIAYAIEPSWFSDAPYDEQLGRPVHPLDNYPWQHTKCRDRQVETAVNIVKNLAAVGLTMALVEKKVD